MMAMFPGIRTIDGNNVLVFKRHESYLPVHYTWIIILVVLYRYTF
jgi:hypothetical protein